MPGQRNSNRKEQHTLDMSFGHLMPQAPEVEKAVLGALMIDKDAYLEVCDKLRPVVPGGCVVKPYNHYCFNCMYQW